MTAQTVGHGTFGGIYWKQYILSKKGDQNKMHKHNNDHATFLHKGIVSVVVDGEQLGTFTAPALIDVPAGKLHQFTAEENDTMYFCMFNADRMNATGF